MNLARKGINNIIIIIIVFIIAINIMINTIINIMFMGKWIDRVYIYRVSFILFDKFRIYSQIRSNSDNESFARLIVSRKIHGKISKTQIRLHFVAVEMGFERGSLGCNRIGASFAEILFTIIKIVKNKNIQRSKIILWDKWIRLNVAEIVSTNPVFLSPVWLEKSRIHIILETRVAWQKVQL